MAKAKPNPEPPADPPKRAQCRPCGGRGWIRVDRHTETTCNNCDGLGEKG